MPTMYNEEHENKVSRKKVAKNNFQK